jgi:uncharacterized membrane protein YdbT with pleckstrin-like domain
MTQEPRRPPVILDMTPEGEFRDAPATAPRGWLDRTLARVGGLAALVTLGAAGMLAVALAIVFVGLLIPVVLVGGAVAYATLRWRARRGGRPVAFVIRR